MLWQKIERQCHDNKRNSNNLGFLCSVYDINYNRGFSMSNYNWCHGPECHTKQTQSRIRGSGRDKVLRTIRIKHGRYNYGSTPEQPMIWDYFCGNHCLMDFIRLHLTSIIAIAPRSKALETPIKVEKEKYENYRMRYNGNGYDKVPYISTRTTINSVDNDNG